VNRIQPFRNIRNRFPGVSLESPPDYEVTLRGRPCATAAVIFHFPSEKCDFRNDKWSFISIRDLVNFDIFRDLYQRPPLARFPEEGAFGC